ncbi:MAG: DUF6279 family lipoprotein [Pseudomonadota bacterium]
MTSSTSERPLIARPGGASSHLLGSFAVDRWLKTALILLLVTLVLAGCGSNRFIYNRLDFILPWYLGRYVDLDREQSRAFDTQMEALLRWHRYEELPEYTALLDGFEAALDAPLTADYLQSFSDDLELAWLRIRDRGLEELLALGNTLSEDQIAEFVESLDDRQEEYEEKYLPRSDKEYREEAQESMEDSLEDFVGRLRRDQKDRLQEAVVQLTRSDTFWLKERADWVRSIEGELARDPGWQDRVRDMIVNWESRLQPDVMAVYDHNTATVLQAVADVLNTRSEKQDKRLRREINDLREDVLALSSQ